MAAAVRGAHSIPVYGWMREECEGAALLGFARSRPATTSEAYKRGRWDALSEFRKLTGGRTRRPLRKVPWPLDWWDDEPVELAVDGFAAVEEAEERAAQRDRIRAWAARRTPRAQCVVEAMLEGRTEAQAALLLGITESGVSHHLHDSRRARSRP